MPVTEAVKVNVEPRLDGVLPLERESATLLSGRIVIVPVPEK